MIKAGSLFFVLIIALVISVLSSALLFISYYHQNEARHYEASLRLAANLESGISLVLARADISRAALDTTLDLYTGVKDTVTLRARRWGLYAYGVVEAQAGRWKNQAAFLYGQRPAGALLAALYLSDLHSSLTVTGDTKITGTAYLPLAGIQSGYIEGKSYTRDSLLYGSRRTSGKTLPPLNIDYLSEISALLRGEDSLALAEGTSLAALQVAGSGTARVITRSYRDSALRIVSRDSLMLKKVTLKGNIILYAAQKITVDSTARLDGVILIAPQIMIGGHTRGAFQAFAADTLGVGPSCTLDYPSSLVLLKKPNSPVESRITLGKNSILRGILLAAGLPPDVKKKPSTSRAPSSTPITVAPPYVRIEKGATLSGILYCAGYLELQGTACGSVLTDHFLMRSPATTYENHLLDAVIDRTALDIHFLASPVFLSPHAKQGIAAWVE